VLEPGSGRALVVGCGLGDDAELLASLGYDVVAFDYSPTAIERCRARFPGSPVEYLVADLLDPPAAWRRAFDLVLEVFTVQSLPPTVRATAIANIAGFVAGRLLVVATQGEPADGPPWPLTREQVTSFPLALQSLDEPGGRWRVWYAYLSG
jgi:SAM-dependent methyltransferase